MVSKGTAKQESEITHWQGKTDVDQPDGRIGTSSTDVVADGSDITLAERLESLKVGVTGALTVGLIYALERLVNQWCGGHVPPLASLSVGGTGLQEWVSLGVAVLAGFLFGVTYRYAIRRDRNSHLGDGVVLAFGLVRGLAQVEARLPFNSEVLPAAVLVAESIVLFAIARLVLDGALHQTWIKTFPSR